MVAVRSRARPSVGLYLSYGLGDLLVNKLARNILIGFSVEDLFEKSRLSMKDLALSTKSLAAISAILWQTAESMWVGRTRQRLTLN